jgi:hypothetical protein
MRSAALLIEPPEMPGESRERLAAHVTEQLFGSIFQRRLERQRQRRTRDPALCLASSDDETGP